jgi:hypothetical protein
MRWVMGMKYIWWSFQVAEVYAVSSTTPTISESSDDCPRVRRNGDDRVLAGLEESFDEGLIDDADGW